jgi:hypothetical protein
MYGRGGAWGSPLAKESQSHDILVPQPSLQRSRVVAGVRQGVAAAVSKHMRVNRKGACRHETVLGPQPMTTWTGEVGPIIVAVKAANEAEQPSAERAAKANAAEPVERRVGDQGEWGPTKHAPDAEPDKRVTGAGTHTESLPSHTQGGRSRMWESRARMVLCGGREMKPASLPLHGLLSLVSKSAFIVCLVFVPLAGTSAQDHATFDLPEAKFKAIVHCLSQGNEVVMSPVLACVTRQHGPSSGDSIARRANMPLGESHWDGDWDKVCADKNDPRRLPADVIKRIASTRDEQVAPTGIRIIGAVFCGEQHWAALDLAGLDLPYSLVIDRSVVNGDLDARNFRIKGDFSFDNAVIVNSLRLNRARIDGSVYGNGSFLERLLVSDTQINGGWVHPNSVIFRDAQFLKDRISGDLWIDGSAFSWLRVQSTHIAGTLDLSETEARCGYHINSSTAGYVKASHAGFGLVKSVEIPGESVNKTGYIDYLWWNRKLSETPKPHTQEIFESPAVAKIAVAERSNISRAANDLDGIPGCEWTTDPYPQFRVSNTTVEDSLCLTSFVWLASKKNPPDDTHPTSILSFNGTRINDRLIIDLWGNQSSHVAQLKPEHPEYRRIVGKYKLEAIALTAGALVVNLSDLTRPYFAHFDELKFSRAYKARFLECRGEFGIQLATQGEPWTVDDVLGWLSKNVARSSQPYEAFAQLLGGDSATQLRVEGRTIELCEKTARALPFIERFCPGQRWSSGAEELESGEPGPGVVARVSELAAVGFQWMLFLLADHGLRPGKVVWWVILTLLVFAIWFWFVAGIVGFVPKRESEQGPPIVWPVSFLFLFDRMIPIYRIRDEHYSIGTVYRMASRDQIEGAAQGAEGPPFRMDYLGRKHLVWPACEADLRRVEKWLAALRVLGAIYAVFLLAALNALTR